MSLPASADVGRTSLAIAPSDADVLYALFSKDADPQGFDAGTYGGFRSDDAGASWEPYGFANQSFFGWYVSVVSVAPTDPDIVFFGGVDLRRYTYPGTTADPVLTPHADQHVLAWDDSGRLLSGNDGGLHRSDDLGDTWEHLNGGLSILQCYAGLSVHPTDVDAILVGNQDNGTVRRHGSQMSDWVKAYGGDGGMTAFASATVAYASWQRTGELATSGDGGFTFGGSIPVTGRRAFHNPFQLDPSDPSRIVYATEKIWDNVGGWSALSGDVTGESTAAIRALAVAPSDSSVVYLATNDYTNVLSHTPSDPNATVQVSTNGGVTFTTILTGHPGWRRITRELWVDPFDSDTLYVARARFGDPVGPVLRTQNGASGAGASFQPLDPNGTLPDFPVNTVVADHRGTGIVLYAGTDSGLYYSVNEGDTWYHFTGMPNAIIVDIVIDIRGGAEPVDRLIIGTQGRGVWSVDIEPPVEFGSADFNQGGTVDELDVADFQMALAAGDVYAIDWDLTTGPGVGDLLDLAAFSNEWLAKR